MDVSETENRHTSKHIGKDAEIFALNYLTSRGLKLIKSNFTCRFGEIDLIMQHGNYLVFIEVRYRKHTQFGDGAESVNFNKQQKILKTAEFFLQRHVSYNQYPCRIDVVSVGSGDNDINWIINAVEA